jgi:HEAT repeat protein
MNPLLPISPIIPRLSRLAALAFAISLFGIASPHAQTETDAARVNRLFLWASSGEVRFRDMVQPAKDSLIAMGETAAEHLATKLGSTDARERHTIADLYAGIGSVAVPYLVPHLDSAGEYAPKNAARCLGRIGDTSATMDLIPKLNHDLYAVRSEVATALGKIADVRAADSLIARLSVESDSDVRKSCTVALGSIGDLRAAPALIFALDDPFFGVRQSAVSALAKLDPPPTAALLGAIKTLDGVALHGAIVALGGTQDARAQTLLFELLDDDDPLIRGFAVEGLTADTTNYSRDRIIALKEHESDRFVRAQIARWESAQK